MTSVACFFAGRSEQSSERPSQAADERSLCGVVSDGSGTTELSAAVPAYADGPSGVCSQWIADSHQPGTAESVCTSGFP